MKPSIYLAHPYAARHRFERTLQPRIEALGIEVVNPFQRGEQAIYEAAMKAGGLTLEMCDRIVETDLEKIDSTNAVVACLTSDQSIGTLMEIFYASYVEGKPVFCFAPGSWAQAHPWIRNLTLVCPTLPELLAALEGWKNEQ